MKKTSSGRFWEIDALRGIAIILMILYHLVFDLNYFMLYTTDLNSLPVLLFLYPVSTTFLLLVGISLTISYSRAQQKLSKQQLQVKFLKRGTSVFGLGLLITLVTWVYPHDGYIMFGVLHCIGLSILLAYPLIRFRIFPLILGIFCIIFGITLRVAVLVDFPWLLWLGFVPSGFYT
ncbi:MAG TPA: heparan-alpha-glucosaminide N-acetyltransferase, partial [Candidatus Thermoplasmatota archaeon]|nr:heparan-alpha-glucosaminide N-acetyltransferase [Candidatus Thermoplasmatota archaeon]